MNTAVGLVETYLRLNGYFTVTKFQVQHPIAGQPGKFETATDLDVLAARLPWAAETVQRHPQRPGEARCEILLAGDPALAPARDVPDILIGEVKEGAAELNRRVFNLAEVGGSDAHFLPVIGSAYTEFPGRTAQDLRRALGERTTRGVSGVYPSLRQIGLGQVLRQTWRGINVTPRTMGWRRTAGSFIQRMLHHG